MRPFLALSALLAVTGVAVAQDDQGAVTDADDTSSAADISSAHAAHDTSNDRLAHVIRFHERISPGTFGNDVAEHGPPGTVCVNIWTRRKPWQASPNYEVCVTADRGEDALVASVSRLGPRGGVKRRGDASAELTSRRRLVVRFDPDRIHRPAAYRWSVQATTFERGCTRRGCQDFAPGRGRSARIELGTSGA
jgi:hypothetical protein